MNKELEKLNNQIDVLAGKRKKLIYKIQKESIQKRKKYIGKYFKMEDNYFVGFYRIDALDGKNFRGAYFGVYSSGNKVIHENALIFDNVITSGKNVSNQVWSEALKLHIASLDL